jgi:hypothetical protein
MVSAALNQVDRDVFDITLVNCGEFLEDFCTVNESRSRFLGISKETRKKDCRDCTFSANVAARHLGASRPGGFTTLSLSDLQPLHLGESVDRFMTEAKETSYSESFHVLGTPVVRLAQTEAILKFKKISSQMNELEHAYFLVNLRNIIKVTLVAESYLKGQHGFHAAISHSPEYGANHAFIHQASRIGIPCYSLRGSNNLAEMNTHALVERWDNSSSMPLPLANWPGVQDLLGSPINEKRVAAHINQLKQAKSPFVYSEPARGLNVFSKATGLAGLEGVKNYSKVVLLALSSSDEILAGRAIGRGMGLNHPGVVFKDQSQWVKETIDWAARRPDVCIVVRIHPRELPNKRERVVSEQSAIWNKLFAELPVNIFVNHPDQKIPLDHVLSISDVFVTGWSTTAIEALLSGVPVVTYDETLISYPSDLVNSGSSKKEYFGNLDRLVGSPPVDSNTLRRHARIWLDFSLNRPTVFVGGRLFENLRINGPFWIDKALNGLDRYLYFVYRPIELTMIWHRNFRYKANRIGQLIYSHTDSMYDLEGPRQG